MTTATGRAVEWDEAMYEGLVRWRDEDPTTGRKVVQLIEEAIYTPGEGHGRPKRLRGRPGLWSRRITQTHRLIYLVTEETLRFVSCYGHDVPERIYEEARS